MPETLRWVLAMTAPAVDERGRPRFGLNFYAVNARRPGRLILPLQLRGA